MRRSKRLRYSCKRGAEFNIVTSVTLIVDFTITVRHWQSENASLYIAHEGPILIQSAVLPIEIRLKTPSWQTCMKLSKTGVLHVLVCLR